MGAGRAVGGLAACFCLLAPLAAAGPADAPASPAAQVVAPGVWLIAGAVPADREPDGNTVVFRAPAGLIVMDTGRHLPHREAILDFARTQNRPIVAIVNSHWHLDHVSGNPDLKRAYPRVKVYASDAIDEALAGFLPHSAQENRKALAEGGLPPGVADDLRADDATIDNGQALRPDVVIAASATRSVGGLRLRINLAPHAATDGDVWVYDARSGVAAVGDLVTLPAPFLDTACSQGWRTALSRIWATPFRIAVPGHGRPLSRVEFATYRAAFDALVDCSASQTAKADCAAAWTRATASLRGDDPAQVRQSQGMTEHYVGDVLRAHGGDSAFCTAPRPTA
ncbi:MAG: MBL fold metallo-hydrolase [Caulobacterales bacterium]